MKVIATLLVVAFIGLVLEVTYRLGMEAVKKIRKNKKQND